MAINLELTSDDFASLYHRSFVDPAKKKHVKENTQETQEM